MENIVLNQDFLKSICAIIVESDAEIVTPMMKQGLKDINAAEIVEKGTVGNEADHVTKIDITNQDYLLEQFRRYLPGSFTVGEENFDNDRDYNIELLSSSDYAWILDPIDGTNNVTKYLKGESQTPPRYGIQGALLHKGNLVAGWIFTSDDKNQKCMMCGAPGVGAFFYIPSGEMMPLEMPMPEADATPHVVTTISAWPKKFQPIVNDNIADGKATIYATPPKSAAHEMMYLLEGKVTAAAFRQFRMWDHLPGLAIVQAAGGTGALFNGVAPELADQRQNGILLTANKDAWTNTRQALLGDTIYDQTEDPKPTAASANPQPKP